MSYIRFQIKSIRFQIWVGERGQNLGCCLSGPRRLGKERCWIFLRQVLVDYILVFKPTRVIALASINPNCSCLNKPKYQQGCNI